MSKKYEIVNLNHTIEDCTIYYLFYLIIGIVIIYLFYNTFNYYSEGFSGDLDYINNEIKIMQLENENEILLDMKNQLETVLKGQTRAIFLSTTYDKVDESSFTDEINFLNVDFDATIFPQIDLAGFNVITEQEKFDSLISEAKQFKNFYKPGEVVTNNSTFNINKEKICYPDLKTDLAIDPNFLTDYPECMVCSINKDYENSKSWLNTKTNIDKICLFNSNVEPNSGIPSLSECKSICNVSQ